MKYKAFISYSHSADVALAPALQSALHAFARPWSSMRAMHVFRDQTSLAASPELWPAIEKALSESEYLLLMASPAAAASHWVGREIEWWFANRPKGTMFILLTEGELAWDEEARDFDWTRTTALPRASLSGRFGGEPLWVDLRWARSDTSLSLRNGRFRSVVLDIAAPLHGKDKDALDGDDVRQFGRLQRVRRGVIAGLATLTLAAAAAAVIAVRQRNEAIRQNTIAQAGRLAAQADLLLEGGGGETELIALLAAESMSMLDGIGEHSAEIDLTLRRTLERLPVSLGETALSSPSLELSPDGSILTAGRSAPELRATRLSDGASLGCADREVQRMPEDDSASSRGRVRAISNGAAWCVVARSETADSLTLERWTSSPLRRVDQRRVAKRRQSITPFISDDGEVLVLEHGDAGKAERQIAEIQRASTGATLLTLNAERFLGFSPDRHRFATTSGLWLTADTASVAPEPVIRWARAASWVNFSRAGSTVVANSGDSLEIWDVVGPTQLRDAEMASGYLLAIRDDGRYSVTLSADSTSVRDARTDAIVATMPIGAEAAAFASRDPTLVVQGGIEGGRRVYRVIRMAASGPALFGTELPSEAVAHSLSFHDDVVDVLLTSGSSTKLSRWIADSAVWRDLYARPRANSVTISADRQQLALSVGRNIATGPLNAATAALDLSLPGSPSLVSLSYNGQWLAALVGDSIFVLATGTRTTEPFRVRLTEKPSAIHVSNDGKYATALYVRDTPSRVGPEHILTRYNVASPAAPISMALGRASRDLGTLCMLSGDAQFISIGDERIAFGASWTGANLTNIAFGECEATFRPSRQLSVAGTRVVVADTASGNVIVRIDQRAPILHAVASSDGRRLATIDDQGGLRIFAIDAKSVIAQLCARRPRQLSPAEWSQYMLNFTRAGKRQDACGRVIADSSP